MSPHILVVDDDPDIRRILELQLKASGYEVTTTPEGASFLEAFDRVRPDACICDVNLPGQNGIALLKRVKEKSPLTPVIMFTGNDTVQDAVEAMKAGAFDWLPKPLELEKLRVTLRNALTVLSQAGEISRLRSQLKEAYSFEAIVGSSPALRDAKALAQKFAASTATVLIRGENGTGKELFARAVHFASPRARGPFVDVNCAALTESLLESEIFGHEKGAFTGAAARHIGKFEQANGGTLFLDEVGDMPLATQAKLLRVLQERSFQRVGGTERVAVDVRVVSATNQDIDALVAQGKFRQDFYYRINPATVTVPPLRERMEDLPELTTHFIAGAARRERKTAPALSAEALRVLKGHSWPGNVRELENVLARAVILCEAPEIGVEHLPAPLASRTPAKAVPMGENAGLLEAVEHLERAMILDALERNGWVKAKAARALKITERILAYKMDGYGIAKEP